TDELRRGPDRRDADARARARMLVDELDALDAYALAVTEHRCTEAAGCGDQTDVSVRAVARGCEHVLRERMQTVAGRDEGIRKGIEHAPTLEQAPENLRKLQGLVTLHAMTCPFDDE